LLSFCSDLQRFGKVAKLAAFKPFASAADALEQINAVSEAQLTDDLKNFLTMNLPKVSRSCSCSCAADCQRWQNNQQQQQQRQRQQLVWLQAQLCIACAVCRMTEGCSNVLAPNTTAEQVATSGWWRHGAAWCRRALDCFFDAAPLCQSSTPHLPPSQLKHTASIAAHIAAAS
jgi:hypothetical protein